VLCRSRYVAIYLYIYNLYRSRDTAISIAFIDLQIQLYVSIASVGLEIEIYREMYRICVVLEPLYFCEERLWGNLFKSSCGITDTRGTEVLVPINSQCITAIFLCDQA